MYNAKSITVRKDAKFDWEVVATLVSEYPLIDADFIARGVKSCRTAGVEVEYFVKRYLNGDKTTPVNKLVDEAHRSLLAAV